MADINNWILNFIQKVICSHYDRFPFHVHVCVCAGLTFVISKTEFGYPSEEEKDRPKTIFIQARSCSLDWFDDLFALNKPCLLYSSPVDHLHLYTLFHIKIFFCFSFLLFAPFRFYSFHAFTISPSLSSFLSLSPNHIANLDKSLFRLRSIAKADWVLCWSTGAPAATVAVTATAGLQCNRLVQWPFGTNDPKFTVNGFSQFSPAYLIRKII